MDVTAQQKALGINGILMNIYGFVLGTDLNTITMKTQMNYCLVSPHFKICFIEYLKSASLKLTYMLDSDDGLRESPIVQFMKKYEITRLVKLALGAPTEDLLLQQLKNDLTGLDFSNLSALTLVISRMNQHSMPDHSDELQNLLSLFSKASSVTQVQLHDEHNTISVAMYKDFLSHFPSIKWLVANFGSSVSADDDTLVRFIEKFPQIERLVHYYLIGNFTLHSDSLKVLNLKNSCLDSIRLICPSLEVLVCEYYPHINQDILIGRASGSALAEKYGNSNRDFMNEIMEFLALMDYSENADIKSIASVSIASTGDNFFQVGNNCRLILLTFNDQL